VVRSLLARGDVEVNSLDGDARLGTRRVGLKDEEVVLCG